MIDLSTSKTWLALPVIGVIIGSEVTLGNNDEIKIIKLSKLEECLQQQLNEKLKESFESWGLTDSYDSLLNNPQVLLVSIQDSNSKTIRNSLIFCDLGLALLNKKLYSFGQPQLVCWDRLNGSAVGAIYQNGHWQALCRPNKNCPPAITKLPKDYWDDFLSKILQVKISNHIEKALLANLEWEREAQQSAHDTHRFAFEWVALESGMIYGERAKGDFVRRLGLLAAAPRSADSKIIQNDPNIKAIFDKYPNPHSKTWITSIQEMYDYRCNILHDGATEVTSINIDPLKVDWFYHLAKHLNIRLQKLLQSAIDNNLSTLDDMWNKHAINFIYSATDDSWVNQKSLTVQLITFDCSKGRYSDTLNI